MSFVSLTTAMNIEGQITSNVILLDTEVERKQNLMFAVGPVIV